VARSFLRRYSGSPVLANADPSLAEWTQWADRAADWLIHQKDREQIEQEFDRLSSRSPSPTGGSVDAADLATMPQGSDNGPAMALAGKPAPAFTLKDLEGKSVELGQLKGSVVVLDFWATWCGPCVQSLPHIAELSREQGPKGLKVFAVNQQEGEAEVKQFLSAHRDLNDLTVLLDSNGAVGAKYLANAIPETVVIGKDGVIKKVFVGAGPDTPQQLHAAVESAMSQQ
jgi:thiol-disulfide isomerase/thioredoxin